MIRLIPPQETFFNNGIDQSRGRAFLNGENLVQVGHVQFFFFSHSIENHKLMERNTFTESLIPAAATQYLRKPAQYFHQFLCVFFYLY
jgi:hypothetical protein